VEALWLYCASPTSLKCYRCPSSIHNSPLRPHHSLPTQAPSMSMHRTSARPTPLGFFSTSNSAYGIDHRKDIGVSHPLPRLPGYLEAPLRDGLRTPPADIMGTAYHYQHPQCISYNSRHDSTCSTPAASTASHNGSYAGANMPQSRLSTLTQPPPPSASTLRHAVQAPNSASEYQPRSPELPFQTDVPEKPDEIKGKRSANSDVIVSSLQIPLSINNSGGSLAEFAAQVWHRGEIELEPRR
jgi:hypothetical protein